MKQIEKILKENNWIAKFVWIRLLIPQTKAYQRLSSWKKGSLKDEYKQEILPILNQRLGSSYTIHELDTEVWSK